MVEGTKYEVLNDGSVPQKQVKDEKSAEEKFHCKKHGIWCRIKARLKLKKHSKGKNKKPLHESEFGCGDEDFLITAESRESLFDQEEKFAYRGATVHVAIIPDKYELLKEVENDTDDELPVEKLSPLTPYDNDDALHEEDDLLQRDKNKLLKEYLAKQWRGKKAKRVRKCIRTGSRSSIKYVERATSHIRLMYPDATTFVSVAARHNQQRRR